MEQVPEGLPSNVREYLFRQLNRLELLTQNSAQLPVLTALPAKPSVGKLYYFGNTIAPTITSVGVWVYKTTGWSYLG